MYIKSVEITNIRSISKFKMEFTEPAGWHVLIGDNGAGKSGFIRSIAGALIGPEELKGIQLNWNEYLKWKEKKGSILLNIERTDLDVQGGISGVAEKFKVQLNIIRSDTDLAVLDEKGGAKSQAKNSLWGGRSGWFSAGYGSFRRFTGGSYDMDKVYENPSYTRLAAHLSLFGEDVALSEATKWLMKLHVEVLEKSISESLLMDIKKFINSSDFLPFKAKLKEISSKGVTFIDGNGAEITVSQMSDGYRSILSLTFELIRQLVRVYGENKVFRNIRKEEMIIDLPGVVLIDEVDTHLHPTWQTRIGQWFRKYFPNMQFIVSTHSPLICRACDTGSIWRLAAPGSEMESGEIKGISKDRLIYGNVLDAYGTDVFGEAVTISKKSSDRRKRMAELNIKSLTGEDLSNEEKIELFDLKQIFPTEKTRMK